MQYDCLQFRPIRNVLNGRRRPPENEWGDIQELDLSTSTIRLSTRSNDVPKNGRCVDFRVRKTYQKSHCPWFVVRSGFTVQWYIYIPASTPQNDDDTILFIMSSNNLLMYRFAFAFLTSLSTNFLLDWYVRVRHGSPEITNSFGCTTRASYVRAPNSVQRDCSKPA